MVPILEKSWKKKIHGKKEKKKKKKHQKREQQRKESVYQYKNKNKRIYFCTEIHTQK